MASSYLTSDQIGKFQVVHLLKYVKMKNDSVKQEAFNKYDPAGEGNITTDQLRQVLRYIGLNPTEAELQVVTVAMTQVIMILSQDMVNAVDKDGTRNIDFPEFLSMMAIKINEENAEEELRFRLFLILFYQ